jgi:tRNA threonylcarbamoyladenosine biosynthesis protein TsaB
MALILALETATTNCSVSISKNGEIIGFKEDFNENYSHSERLHCYIEEVVTECNINLNELDAIAVSKGPGSYTGLRIGVSAAKGLCISLDIPLISVNTLESLANQIYGDSDIIIPMLDARRMEVYSSVYSSNKEKIRKTKAEILDKKSFSDYSSSGKIIFIGNGAKKYKDICPYINVEFHENNQPSAKEMGPLAYSKFLKKEFEDVAYFEPYYLKDFILG